MSDLISRTKILEQILQLGPIMDNRGRYVETSMLYEILDLIENQPAACSEERIPKIPYLYGDGYSDGELIIDMYECPNCGEGYELEYQKYKYCPNCGQAIDWPQKTEQSEQ